MKKFRVKPGEVEAEQYHFVGNPNPYPAVKQMPVMCDGIPTMRNILQTPAGMMVVHEGDWIIKFPDGNLGVMDHGSFEENYEQV